MKAHDSSMNTQGSDANAHGPRDGAGMGLPWGCHAMGLRFDCLPCDCNVAAMEVLGNATRTHSGDMNAHDSAMKARVHCHGTAMGMPRNRLRHCHEISWRRDESSWLCRPCHGTAMGSPWGSHESARKGYGTTLKVLVLPSRPHGNTMKAHESPWHRRESPWQCP